MGTEKQHTKEADRAENEFNTWLKYAKDAGKKGNTRDQVAALIQAVYWVGYHAAEDQWLDHEPRYHSEVELLGEKIDEELQDLFVTGGR